MRTNVHFRGVCLFGSQATWGSLQKMNVLFKSFEILYFFSIDMHLRG
jgi:hypothetical protein